MRTLVIGSPGPLLDEVVEQLQLKEIEVRILGASVSIAEVLEGDATAIDFGMSGGRYLELREWTDEVLIAIEPDLSSYRNPAEARPVKIALEVCEFVEASTRPIGVTFLSSLLIFGGASGHVGEGDFRVGQSFGNPLEESLALAEKIIRETFGMARALKILRVAPLVGSRRRGVVDQSSTLAELLHLLQTGALSQEGSWVDRPVYFETSDRAALALARLAIEKKSVTAHLVDHDPPSDRELCEWFGERLGIGPQPNKPSSRLRRPLLTFLRHPERRAFSGWELTFGRSEAERLNLEGLDQPWADLLSVFVPSHESRTD